MNDERNFWLSMAVLAVMLLSSIVWMWFPYVAVCIFLACLLVFFSINVWGFMDGSDSG